MPTDATIALVTRDEAKLFQKFTGATEDTIVDSLIDQVSRAVASHVGRELIAKDRTEFYDGDGTDTLLLGHYPVNSVASVHDDLARVFDASVLVDAADYFIEKESGMLRIWQGPLAFSKGKGNVKVIYNAGYVTVTAVPQDLKLATNLWIASLYNKRKEERYGISSTSAGQTVTTFREDDVPGDVRAILAQYRRLGDAGRFFA